MPRSRSFLSVWFMVPASPAFLPCSMPLGSWLEIGGSGAAAVTPQTTSETPNSVGIMSSKRLRTYVDTKG